MGSSESKLAESSKPELKQCITNKRLNLLPLVDPRSPSIDIDRTPIHAGGPVLKTSDELSMPSSDPRSPTIGITRTPIRDAVRVTVGSFARRLGMIFHSEVAGRAPVPPQQDAKLSSLNIEEEEAASELGSNEPLLASPVSLPFCSLAEQTTPVQPTLRSICNSSPFVHLGEAQVDVETEADLRLELAVEASESPDHKRLCVNLMSCHQGEGLSRVFAEVHHDGPSPLVPGVVVEPVTDDSEHSYALPSVIAEPESSSTPVQHDAPEVVEVDAVPTACSEQVEEAALTEPSVDLLPVLQQSPECSLTTLEVPAVPTPEPSQKQPQLCTGIRCPTFDPKSPSQVVFKPQWLGRGFGTTGLKAREVQVRAAKGGSSPLVVRVAVKNATNENKGQSVKLKQKGMAPTESRSPLQILKDNNSPREQRTQVKLKVATSDRQTHERLGKMDRRVLNMAVDKENR